MGESEHRLDRMEEMISRIDKAIRGDGNGSPGLVVRIDRLERAAQEIKSARSRRFTFWHGILIAALTVGFEQLAVRLF